MLIPAELQFSPEGPRSAHYEDRYYGQVGALQQAHSVFLQGCSLPQAWQRKRVFSILETGFGLGFNFLAAWQAWKHDPLRPERLHFLSIECHPVSALQLAKAHASEPYLAALSRQLRLNLPPVIEGLHRLEFEQGSVCLTLVYAHDVHALQMLSEPVDAIFLDGFAPDRNPALWSQEVLDCLFKLSKQGTRLSTWCAASEIRKRLSHAGFEVERGPSIGNKRETTLAKRLSAPNPSDLYSCNEPTPSPDQKEVIVLGAGLAGTAITERLLQHGWQVTLIDAAPGPGKGASGNLAGIVRPLVSKDDNHPSQFTRAAMLYAIQRWERRNSRPHPCWHPTGVLQIARDKAQLKQWIAMMQAKPMPSDWIQLLSQEEAAKRCGYPVPDGGLLFPQAGWAEPSMLCQITLESSSTHLSTRWATTVHTIQASSEKQQEWLALDQQGKTIAHAPHIVIASGAGLHIESPNLNLFLPPVLRPLQKLRGEITHFNLKSQSELDLVICGEGYICPSPDQTWSVGATYDEHHLLDVTPSGIHENAHKLKTLTGITVNPEEVEGGRAGYRSVAWDRLPIIGADPAHQGLWHCRALASRGLAWHGIAAELLIAKMEHEPPPLCRKLSHAVSPHRRSIQQHSDKASERVL